MKDHGESKGYTRLLQWVIPGMRHVAVLCRKNCVEWYGLKDARERRDEARKLLANGIDPGATGAARAAWSPAIS